MKKSNRFSVTVSDAVNEWLEKRSDRLGVTKSSITSIALEYYMTSQMVLENKNQLMEMLQQMNKITQKIESGELKLNE